MVSPNEKSAPLLLMMLAAMSCISHAFVAQPIALANADFGRSIQQQQSKLKFGLRVGYAHSRKISPALFMSSPVDTDDDGIDTKQDDDFAPSDADDNPAGSSYQNTYTNTNAAAQFDFKPNGIGEWEEMHGNYILRPPASDQEPRCVTLRLVSTVQVFLVLYKPNSIILNSNHSISLLFSK